MTDNRTVEQRSFCMKQIRSKNTTPEMIVRKYLHKNGFRYSLHNKKLPGKPDITLRKYGKVIFVHGCYWHGHKNCENAKTPKSNKEFWIEKIKKNQTRDATILENLQELNWKVISIWECQLKKNRTEETLKELVDKIVN
jgi:DNA mismatch endonuclease, patch repair protein